MKSDVNHAEWTLKLADWVSDDDAKYGSATRPSDFMLQHLKDFKNASGDANWDRVIDKTYSISEEVYKNTVRMRGCCPTLWRRKTAAMHRQNRNSWSLKQTEISVITLRAFLGGSARMLL